MLHEYVAKYDRLPVRIWKGGHESQFQCRVYKGVDLYNWCTDIRYRKRTGKLSKEQERQLEEVKYWVWQVRYDCHAASMYSGASAWVGKALVIFNIYNSIVLLSKQ